VLKNVEKSVQGEHLEHFFFSLDKHSVIAYNTCMGTNKYANFRAFKEDVAVLKEIAAMCRESMVQTFKRLVQQEYRRVREEGGKCHAADEKDQA
jgi:L-lactate utilization protein LutB